MYAKIFLKIFDSSIAEDWQARIVFQDILILANRDGMVDMTHEAIARRTNVPLEIVRASIAKLEAPDPKSNTPEDDGRRLERLAEHKDWGWRILNYTRYRDIKNSEEMREANRKRLAEWRARKKAAVENGSDSKSEKSEKPAKTPPADCVTIFCELNDLTGSKFRPEGKALAMLIQRLAQPDVTCDGVLQMVRRQVKRWKEDPQMCEYLTPLTLFNETKFNNYYAARELPASTFNERSNQVRNSKPPITPVKGSTKVAGF